MKSKAHTPKPDHPWKRYKGYDGMEPRKPLGDPRTVNLRRMPGLRPSK